MVQVACTVPPSTIRSQGIRQYVIERRSGLITRDRAVPSPVRPAGLIGVAVTGCDGDTFEETAVHSADESTLQLNQTPCNVAEVVFEPNWVHVRKLNGEILQFVEVGARPASVLDFK